MMPGSSSIQPTLTPLYLRHNEGGGVDDSVSTQSQEKSLEKHDKGYLCKVCNRLITKDEQRCSMNGKQQHTFFNPAGVVFEIGCFSKAEGCSVVGNPSTEFSWFAGASWRYALCVNCLSHLGWYYEGETTSFFGLILTNITEGEL